MKQLIIILSLLCIGLQSEAQQKVKNEADTFPIPPVNKNMMFYLQRTPNTNTIIYALNFKNDNTINENTPIKVYWIRYTEPGQPIKGLSAIQRQFAYGIKSKKIASNTWDLRMVAYDKLPITLRKNTNGTFNTYITINGTECIFKKAYIKVDGGTFWSPNIPYIEIYASDKQGRQLSYKILNPK